MHYWRLDPADWRPCLEAVLAMGLPLVDIYLPWSVHEVAPGKLDLGGSVGSPGDPRLDVVAFLRLAHDLGLHAIVRPGPHINAELTYFGLPERVVWDPACQARGPTGQPVILPVPPCMFPVPSYASEAYHDEVKRYFHTLGAELAPLRHPDGPIVMLQIDNEGAHFFRDGAFDQDYHPDAIAQYRVFLRERYPTLDALRLSYGDVARVEGDDQLRFTNVLPPVAFASERLEDMAYQLEWAEFQEWLLARSLGRFADALGAAGLDGVPTCHNFPMAQHTTPLNAARVGEVVDLVGYDFYGGASEGARVSVARRASELSVRCDGLDVPAYACEMGAGFPPYFPPLAERDSIFTALTALAYGLRGFNVYMAVERDRWIGAPVDRHGRRRPFAEVWRKLCAALDATEFQNLHRHVPVRVLVPRVERRLARVTHAFGPASAALMAVAGRGPRESCFEHEFGQGYPLALESDTFVRAFEQALDARGLPWALVGGEDRDISLRGARWVVCATSGGFAPALADQLREAAGRGARVTIGPRPVERDGSFVRCAADLGEFEMLQTSTPATADGAVARAIEELDLTCHPCDPDGIHATVHHDAAGVARVAFVINPTSADVVAHVSLGSDGRWRDVLEDDETTSSAGLLELRVRPRTVRMLALVEP